MTTASYPDGPFRQCAGCGDDIWPGEAYGVSAAGDMCAICLAKRRGDPYRVDGPHGHPGYCAADRRQT